MSEAPSAEAGPQPAAAGMAAAAPLLRTENLTIRFGGLTALDNIDVTVARGQVRAIIGPNGAGKSTFFNCLAGDAQVCPEQQQPGFTH